MAIYRTIQMSFWTDSAVIEDYSADDKLLYLYLLTNPHTNLAGCYEITATQIANEVGFSRKKAEELLTRAERDHGTIIYSKQTKEVMVVNWHKYNWTSSEKFRKPLWRDIENVKNGEFKAFLTDLFNGNDTVLIPYQYRTDTTVTDTDTVSDTVSISDSKSFKVIKNIYYPNDEKLDQAFRDFVEMRRMIKAPMTERAITIAMNKLNDLAGNDNDLAIQIIDEAIEHNWKSFYPLKEKKKPAAQEWEEA